LHVESHNGNAEIAGLDIAGLDIAGMDNGGLEIDGLSNVQSVNFQSAIVQSVNFQSFIVQSCNVVRQCPVLQFQSTRHNFNLYPMQLHLTPPLHGVIPFELFTSEIYSCHHMLAYRVAHCLRDSTVFDLVANYFSVAC